MFKYLFIAFLSSLFSSLSQVLLKKSSNNEHKTIFSEYLNFYVIFGYIISFICMGMMIFAFKGIPLKFAPAIEASAYIYIMVLSRVIFKEKITRKKFFGILLIVFGIIISIIE